ncbi:MAG: TlpA family protein disulfide reductase [Sedimentisphaerales bacterium]|nr:TlpA family protein disulfide reductase [Sedimentisphaerales bacterium]
MVNFKWRFLVVLSVLWASLLWGENGSTLSETARVEEPNWTIEITAQNKAGEMVDDFEARLSNLYDWTKGENGKVTLTKTVKINESECKLLLRAPGFAPAVINLKPEPGQVIRRKITLSPANYVMTINSEDGRELPESLKPVVTLEPFLECAVDCSQPPMNFTWDLGATRLEGKGRYVFSVPDEVIFYVIVDQPGFLRWFVAGPFTTTQAKAGLAITLPTPGRLSVTFGPEEGQRLNQSDAPYEKCVIDLDSAILPEIDCDYTIAHVSMPEMPVKLPEDYYPPGYYDIYVSTHPAENVEDDVIKRGGHAHPGMFYHQKSIRLRSGQKSDVKMIYTPYHADFYKGDVKAIFNIQSLEGQPITDQPYVLTCCFAPQYATTLIARGILDESGRIVVENLGAHDYELQIGDRTNKIFGKYRVEINGRETEFVKTYSVASLPLVGDSAPDICLQETFSEKTVRLGAFRGKVVFIDFWATWCGGCQKPMEHLNELWSRKQTEWEGKVVLVGASVDKEKERLQEHIEKMHWNKIAQYWCHEKDDYIYFGAVAGTKYGVSRVPTCFLINQNGKIAWKGSPGDIALEAEIAKLLQDR